MFNDLAESVHVWAIGQGFYDRDIPGNLSFASEKILLIAVEVAREIQDAMRDGDKEHEAEEVADAIIRLLDYAAWRGIDIDLAIHAKMDKNRMRPPLHGRAVF
jgi:NTP pyrophosphatase (non-canonical NTP hydrolase)